MNRSAIEAWRPKSRDDWLARRRLTVGMSEVPALFGVHTAKMTAFELFTIKKGIYEPKFGGTIIEANSIHLSPADRGLLFEAPAIECVRRLRPHWLVTHNTMPGGTHYIDRAWGLSATPDAFITDPDFPGRACLQIKSIAFSVFNEEWKGDAGVQLPLGVAVQAAGDADLSGCERAYACVIVAHWGVDVYLFEVPLKPRLMATARTLAADFWRRVAEDRPYPPDFAKDGEALAAYYGDDSGGAINLPDSEDVRKLVADHERLADIERKAAKAKVERKAIDMQLIAMLGNAAAGWLPDGRMIEAKVVKNYGYAVAPFSYRPVKVRPGLSKKTSKGEVLDGPF